MNSRAVSAFLSDYSEITGKSAIFMPTLPIMSLFTVTQYPAVGLGRKEIQDKGLRGKY